MRAAFPPALPGDAAYTPLAPRPTSLHARLLPGAGAYYHPLADLGGAPAAAAEEQADEAIEEGEQDVGRDPQESISGVMTAMTTELA